MPCAIAGAGKLPAAAMAVAPSSASRASCCHRHLPLRQRQAPGVAVAGFRQLAESITRGEEGHVAARRTPCRSCEPWRRYRRGLLAELAECLDQPIIEAPDLDALVGAQDLESLDVLSVEFGERRGQFGGRCGLDQRADPPLRAASNRAQSHDCAARPPKQSYQTLLAAAQLLHPARAAHNPKPIDTHYQAIRIAMKGVFHELGLAA